VATSILDDLCRKVESASSNGHHIFTIGNGGSSAIAEHLCCDWTKGTTSGAHPIIRSRSLTSNNPLYSAIANDFGFERVFATQLELLASAGDLLIAISSSGNSANIIAAAESAKRLGMEVVGLTGFSGGRLAQLADVSIHVPAENYGIVEDAHQALIHVVAQFIACSRDRAPGN
jgi:phosphoheptose isomerase